MSSCGHVAIGFLWGGSSHPYPPDHSLPGHPADLWGTDSLMYAVIWFGLTGDPGLCGPLLQL